MGRWTLISVKCTPITSMPVKISPRRFQFRADGRAADTVRAVSSVASRPATCMLERACPARGTRLICREFPRPIDDALVALAHLGKIALDDHRSAVDQGEHLHQRAEISSRA